jgi:hypothetical protein
LRTWKVKFASDFLLWIIAQKKPCQAPKSPMLAFVFRDGYTV